MENQLNPGEKTSGDGKLTLSELSKYNLRQISQWTMFFSVLGFAAIGILVLGGFFFGNFISRLSGEENVLPYPGYILGIIYAILGAIYLPPVIFLFRFTRHIRGALQYNRENELDKAFINLRSHYRYMGILTAIALIVYLFAGIIIGVVSVLYK